ncbi:hypothetical protein K2173_025523 [Erythroxylum novogranatense]|uniref:Uncharacterized protein n=1 Tax=Erythroxylum novogranatense TaxID=1862640 RepID=A0AAV8T928_9ROSI|nr:hypothetical protein K2173_025523 [Erythroxylum novogranatense]
MEVELEGRVKPLSYKVKGVSRESPSQKASHVLDTDLRSHWSSATNTKEWILLELDEPCLLSHFRIYNKSVLEWEIAVGLRYKPETFVKVRPRCEAPRRDMIYPMNYTPCRYVRISCLRGNPIAIFFIQLIGVSVTSLEAEFQPVVNHLLPNIISHKQDAHDMHLQLLQDMTKRLLPFLPQVEADLTNFIYDAEQNLRFLAMLVGPFYPILQIVNERETSRSSGNVFDSEGLKSSQSVSSLTVSSNFEPRRSRSTSPFVSATSSSMVFCADAIFMLLRKAYKESNLGTVCRMAARVLHKLIEPVTLQEGATSVVENASVVDESAKFEVSNPVPLVDYSILFGEDFQIPDDHWDSSILNLLDIGAVEEGILHVLYACASQPLLCHKLAEGASELWSALPLIQALLPALRPGSNLGDRIDDNFSLWKQPFVQQALSQIVAMSCSALYRPLLHACAGYLSSFSQSHAKAACVLIDLCSSVLAPWMPHVIAKVDLSVELLEDLLGIIQDARYSITRARALLKYIVLALLGHMDDMLGKYKEVKHRILFLLEMLEPFLDPVIYAHKSMIAFGDVSFSFSDKQEQAGAIALNVIRTAVQKPAVLPSLESEWRRGAVAPSVLLSILEPHMQLPADIDLCKYSASENTELESSSTLSYPSMLQHGGTSAKSNNQEVQDGKADVSDTNSKVDIVDDVSLLFAPSELLTVVLINASSYPNKEILESNQRDINSELKHAAEKKVSHLFQNDLQLDAGFAAEYFDVQANYMQLVNYRDCELRASEFRRLASDLNSQSDKTVEGHDAAIDALLLAAECYVNPFFMMSVRSRSSNMMDIISTSGTRDEKAYGISELKNSSKRNASDLERIAVLENERDKLVLQILLEAAELDGKFHRAQYGGDVQCYLEGPDDEALKLSPIDVQSADAVTLVRQNQATLFSFLVRRLKKERDSLHEILMHCLVFLLNSATWLYCAPEEVIDIILGSGEYLNGMITSLYHQCKEGNLQLDTAKMLVLRRRWHLLQRLVIASSDGDGSDFAVNDGNRFRAGNLIPSSAWMQKISSFSFSACPLVRFLGWMAISRNAKQYIKDRFSLANDLSQLTYLLSIFADELSVVGKTVNQKPEDEKNEQSVAGEDSPASKQFKVKDELQQDLSFHVLYPDLSMFFPHMKRQFQSFAENILEAVGLQLKAHSSSTVPDILCWFSDLCSWPFSQNDQIIQSNSYHVKGYMAKNAKAIILYLLEAIVTEHMEAMVPEIPRVVQILVSLCRATYCDVEFLDSLMRLLKPIISYSLKKASKDEEKLVDDSCLTFESLCFEELFDDIRHEKENRDASAKKEYSRALTIFILACVFTDLSFQRRREILLALTLWADFTNFEPTTVFHDYLYAFQMVLESCKSSVVQTLGAFGLVPLQNAQSPALGNELIFGNSEVTSWFLNEICDNTDFSKISENLENNDSDGIILKQKDKCLRGEEVEDFTKGLESVIAKLNPTIERCWKLHRHLAKKLAITSARCILYSKCLSSINMQVRNAEDNGSESSLSIKPLEQVGVHWRIGLEGLAEVIIKLQEIYCWEVASLMLDCLFGVPHCFPLDNVIDTICSAIKAFSFNAPKLSWRLQSDKWLKMLLSRGLHSLHEGNGPLSDLFVTLLGHPEPEQRFMVLQHLGRLVGLDANGEEVIQSSASCNKLLSPSLVSSVAESFLSLLISSIWDRVVLMASSEMLLPLKTHAMVLVLGFIPYAARHQLQSFLAGADSVFRILGGLAYPACQGPQLRLSLALVAGACLYSPVEDIELIPQDVWRFIETIGSSKSAKVGDLEKNICEVLCKLRNEGDEAKEVLREALSSSSSNQVDPDFGNTRESILQVLANLTSVEAYFDMFTEKLDQEAMEVEEAQMELDILQKEHATKELSNDSSKERQNSLIGASMKHKDRLQHIKDRIQSIEKSKVLEDVVARRHRKLLVRRARQKYLEDAALREEGLLQELDRERMAEAEKELERQRLLELERSKTRELRHNLDMEKEKQTQRELQRELEQAESGLRSSRRDFSSSTHGRRYRERENGRSSNEATARTSSGSLQPDMSTASTSGTIPTVVLSGSRAFSGQTPTILQSRDRLDEGGSSYEENFDGSRDLGDTGSVGDPDASALDGQSGGFGSAQRHVSRGSKSRQVIERREREGRREGKWERKH